MTEFRFHWVVAYSCKHWCVHGGVLPNVSVSLDLKAIKSTIFFFYKPWQSVNHSPIGNTLVNVVNAGMHVALNMNPAIQLRLVCRLINPAIHLYILTSCRLLHIFESLKTCIQSSRPGHFTGRKGHVKKCSNTLRTYWWIFHLMIFYSLF